MSKLLLLFTLILFTSVAVTAQDTLWIKQREGKPYLPHRIRTGETLFILSKRYAVPPAILADLNNINYQDGLATGTNFIIPVDNYNFIRIESVVNSRPIFYRTGEGDDLHSISRLFNIPQSALQRWNKLDIPEIESGKTLQVGWIAYDQTQVPFPNITLTTTPSVSDPPNKVANPSLQSPKDTQMNKDGVKEITLVENDNDSIHEIPAFEQLYEQQTGNVSVSEESGAAVFYPLKMQAGNGVYYAFHNTAIRGSILKIMNPANGKIIYAKVIGTVPDLKEYYNSIVGLSNNAANALGARDHRMFCKIRYR